MVPYRIGEPPFNHVVGDGPRVVFDVEGRGEQAVLALVEPDDEDEVERSGLQLARTDAHKALGTQNNKINSINLQ